VAARRARPAIQRSLGLAGCRVGVRPPMIQT
jgi:hypothetical protein